MTASVYAYFSVLMTAPKMLLSAVSPMFFVAAGTRRDVRREQIQWSKECSAL